MQWLEAHEIRHSPFKEDFKWLIVKFVICETNVYPFKIPKSAVRCFQVQHYCFALGDMPEPGIGLFLAMQEGLGGRAAKRWIELLIDKLVNWFSRKEKSKRFDRSDCSLLVIVLFARPAMSGFRWFGHLVTLHSCVLKWIKIKSLTWKGYFKTDCACGFESWCFEQRRDWFNGINA